MPQSSVLRRPLATRSHLTPSPSAGRITKRSMKSQRRVQRATTDGRNCSPSHCPSAERGTKKAPLQAVLFQNGPETARGRWKGVVQVNWLQQTECGRSGSCPSVTKWSQLVASTINTDTTHRELDTRHSVSFVTTSPQHGPAQRPRRWVTRDLKIAFQSQHRNQTVNIETIMNPASHYNCPKPNKKRNVSHCAHCPPHTTFVVTLTPFWCSLDNNVERSSSETLCAFMAKFWM